MSKEAKETIVEIMGKIYHVKCSEEDVSALQQAAQYLETKMYEMRQNNNFLSLERLAVITALNMTHQYLNFENKNQGQAHNIQQRLINLQNKIDNALVKYPKMEPISADQE